MRASFWRLAGASGLVVSLAGASNAQVRQVNIATDATDTANSGDTEPSIAVNPVNPLEIVVVAFSGNWGPTQNAPVWKSSDGGLTWRRVPQIPQPQAGAAGPNDQKVAFDSQGRLHIAELATGGTNLNFIFRQTGAADAALTPGASYGDDQPHLDIDISTAGACAGRMYSPWLNFGVALQRTMVTNSANRGVNVTNVAVGNNATFPNRTSRVAIAPNGRVYVIYKTREGGFTGEPNQMENAHFRVTRSDDCGATWNANGAGGVSVHGAAAVQTFFTNQFGNPAGGRPVARARSSDAWIAADPGDGDIYAAYVRRDNGFGQIFVARSTDQGVTWTSTRVTDGTQHSAYPEIAVAANGAIGVLYVDFVDTGTATQFRHRFARSFDNGATWNDQILQSMNPAGLAGAASGFLWGDYEGLTAFGNTFYGVYTGQATGRTTPQLDPIFFRDSAFAIPPKIQITSPLVFPDSCGLAAQTATLQVCNTGGGALTVLPITSSAPAFTVVPPTGGFPLSIGAGSCFPLQVKFTPTGPGPATATLTVPSDDPVNLTVNVAVQANVGAAKAVTVVADTGNFGELCAGTSTYKDLPITINNSGSCTLTISSISSSAPADFEMAQVLAFPMSVAPGASTTVPIRFHPSSPGSKSGVISIATNDPTAPTKTVNVSGVAPPEYVCNPPLFAAIDAAIGPTFGTGRTGKYTFNGSGKLLASFGPRRTFAIQAGGEYMFFPGRQEGQLDAALLYRRGILQFGVSGSFKDANLRTEAQPGSLSHASLSLDVLLPAARVGIFGSKGLHETSVVTLSETIGLPTGSGSPIIATERVFHTVDQLGGAVQGEVIPNSWIDGNIVYLNRHAPGVGDTVGAAVRFSRLLFPGVVGVVQLDVNESYLGQNTVGTITFGVTLGRWSRPSDYANPVNPLGTWIPRVHYELFTRVR